jgi:uncharacterized protein YjbI with pentapeptide repeats
MLTNADLSGASLTNADLNSSTLTNANLSGASIKNADLRSDTLPLAIFDANTVYNQWTVFPPEFDPAAQGLTLIPSPVGDFDANDALDIVDIDLLQSRIRLGYRFREWLPTSLFGLNNDAQVDANRLGREGK